MKKLTIAMIALCSLSLCFSELASAQRRGGGFNRGWIGLLRMESVQREIELVADQQEDIKSLQEEMWESMQEKMLNLRDLPSEERSERFRALRTEMETRQKEYEEKIKEVLLPHQAKRMAEIEVQSQFRRYGAGALGLLKNDDMLKDLGIDDDQKKEMEEKAEVVKRELDEQIKELRKKAEEKVLAVLSSEQRKKFRDKVGETFDFDSESSPLSRFR